MPYVICAPCEGKKDLECIQRCPSDAIHPKPDDQDFPFVDQLFINPQTCTDCGWCADACPEHAIYAVDNVPVEWQSFIKKNRDYYQHHSS